MSFKAGFVGVLGLPNAGKSTLVNAIVGEKISIVTSKPQTTRKRILGVTNSDNYQCVWVDSPGYLKPGKGLTGFLRREAEDVISSSDLLLLVLATDVRRADVFDPLFEVVSKAKKPWFAVINKTDLKHQHRVWMLNARLASMNVESLTGSALKTPQKLKDQVLAVVEKMLPESKGPLYPQDLFTLSQVRDMAGELIRERCFECLHQEVPFGLAVSVLKFDETSPELTKIRAQIITAKQGHKSIVVGESGAMVKKIGTLARREIEKLLQTKIYLELEVKTRVNWSHSEKFLKEYGYVVNGAN